jgi:hypothetical protein
MLVATLIANFRTQSIDGGDALPTHFLLAPGSLSAPILVVRRLYVRAGRFLFSPIFWLLVRFLFYLVLKVLGIAGKDLVTLSLVNVLCLCRAGRAHGGDGAPVLAR